MKKMISMALVLILLMGMMVGAQAEETGKVVVSEAEAAPGENVEITISLQNVTLLCHAAVELVYDENVLEWIDVEPVDYSSANGRVQMSTDSTRLVWWFNPSKTAKNADFDGVFAKLTFKVKEDAPIGDTVVGVEIDEDDFYYTTEYMEEENTPFVKQDGKVTVKAAEPEKQVELYGASTTLGGEIGLNFFLAPTEEQIADEGFKVTLDGTEYLLKDAKTRTVDGKTLYQFTVALRAKQMNKKVEIKAFDGKGEAVALYRPKDNEATESFSFSIVDYVKKSVGNAANGEDVKTLARALSDYGSLTQLALPYEADKRAELYNEAGIKAVTAAELAEYAAQVTSGEASGVSYVGSTLVLDSVTDLRIYLKADAGELKDYSFELNGSPATLGTSSQGSYIQVSNVAAKNLDNFNTLVVKNSEGKVVLTVKASVLSYVQSVVSGDKSEELTNAMKALYLYNRAADNYFK